MTTATATSEIQEATELASLMQSRSGIYGLLARIYREEATESLLEEMRGMRFPTSTGSDSADEGYRLLYTYLKGIWDDSVVQLATDYVRTFIGHGVNAFSAAYPFESVHTSERRLLMQEARDEVLAIYRANNLKRGEWNEGEDHIALELEFMQVMSQRTSDALQAGNEDEAIILLKTQNNFLHDHLLNWVPMLVGDMLKFSQTDFYQGTAKLTQGFLETEEALLRDLLENVE